ncbi:purine-nucleoside phosphorylase [Facklamia sp. DSM 111018]|uniref:Purine nucleoside phosphorylase n=1 Tax=Facklamia lactis TaxID=2749967 RepID=A0ABS0LMX0_9LACT|nr:purine-nucleoside phosphorylase [Facklamia lactis]MBG9979836.1 purine-nucleoside phosphorylase [Facklamia lactis]MBG9985484.1 purine-nucleoside phosphorylase [Facklamia lactis]
MYTNTLTYLREHGVQSPDIGLILGSGLGDMVEEMTNAIKIKYEDIPDFPTSTVEGHEGRLVYGELAGKKVIALQGRFHYYEGYDLETVTYPIRIFNQLGVKTLILTNAAGGVNEEFKPGDLMVITDHLNLTGENPLIGSNKPEGPRFVDMSQTYSHQGQTLLYQAASELGYHLQKGVYTWFTGPSYETPAEIRAVRTLGGDAVGMSTVPEAIVGRHCEMEIIGISCITNYAAGMQEHLNHEEVVTISQIVKPKFKALLNKLIEKIGNEANLG